MRRHAKGTPFERLRLSRLRSNLQATLVADWPVLLQRAFEILPEKLTHNQRRQILVASVSEAHECCRIESRKATDLVRFDATIDLWQRAHRVARCVGRAPSQARR